MKRHWRNRSHDDGTLPDSDSDSDTRSNRRFPLTRLMALFLFSLFLFSLTFILPHPHIQSSQTAKSLLQLKQTHQGDTSESVELLKDKLLGGLIADGFDEKSCRSRYDSLTYGKRLSGNPSSYLVSRLRKYEALHKECGPYTESYNRTVRDLRSGHVSESSACKYVVWISYSGLGNRILTLASTFLYALLTDRVLLVDPGVDMVDLFCEPFPHVSWFLPPDFPLNSQFPNLGQKSDQCYGKMLKNKSITDSMVVPSFLYLHLVHDYDDQDKLFFCDGDQTFLQKVPWLLVKTDNYFVPSLFLMPSFEQELNNLFPNKETVFHFLVFDSETGPFQHVLDQILACTLKANLLSDVNRAGNIVNSSGKPKSKAVLMTSLSSGYFEKVRDMYWEYPTVTGEIVGIYQPSHEGYQQTEKQLHNQKAWAEMYLLSLTDELVTSSWSTFGYVSQGLGGLKPWILYKPENRTAPDPPCQRAMSTEPCFHAPPFYDCKAKRGIDTGALVPHVRHCEDMSWGLKLVDKYSWQ
uniref:Fucosyltransferase n=1 Tax=Cajanus cajan TaxID=3821 RepID=A0A151TRS2_CAJCA|nr:Galactoside 2-alpha-L-fucosyltransferase [Cajanus cajan]